MCGCRAVLTGGQTGTAGGANSGFRWVFELVGEIVNKKNLHGWVCLLLLYCSIKVGQMGWWWRNLRSGFGSAASAREHIEDCHCLTEAITITTYNYQPKESQRTQRISSQPNRKLTLRRRKRHRLHSTHLAKSDPTSSRASQSTA